MTVLQGLLIPFLGTSLGAAFVFLLRRDFSPRLTSPLYGFAGGVMTAASIWSLLLPAIESATAMGTAALFAAMGGFLLGGASLLLLDRLLPEGEEGSQLFWAVTIHNVPEGMAIGVVLAAFLSGSEGVTAMGALSLAIGVAVQNVPEGAVISLPLHAKGLPRARAFLRGVLSGAVEPVAGAAALVAASRVTPMLPFLLSYAAGCMIYVVVKELVPAACGEKGYWGAALFFAGFTVMMVLDVTMG